MDYEYISEVLCINKDKPKLNCNGKCYLMQSLAEAAQEETDQKKENLLKKVDIPLLYVHQTDKNESQPATQEEKEPAYSTLGLYSFQQTSTIFHPPILS